MGSLLKDVMPPSDDKSSGASLKDREERLRQLRDRQQLEKQQKLEELKEHVSDDTIRPPHASSYPLFNFSHFLVSSNLF